MPVTGATHNRPCHHRPHVTVRSEFCKAAVSRLAGSGYLPLRKVRCEENEGVLTISGTVPSYYLKQIAQTLVATVEGVTRVENRLEVRTMR